MQIMENYGRIFSKINRLPKFLIEIYMKIIQKGLYKHKKAKIQCVFLKHKRLRKLLCKLTELRASQNI